MSNLIPTQRTDKNGRTVIRHMKPVASHASNMSRVPAPAVGKPRTAKERLKDIEAFLHKGRRGIIPSMARRWLADSVPEELDRLDSVLSEYDEMPEREQFVVREAMNTLSNPRANTEFIHESLALRSAFCGEWSVENQPAFSNLSDYIMGLRESFGLSLEHHVSLRFRDEQELREAISVTRFTYEMDRRFPRQAFRPAEHAYVRNTGDSYLQHKDPALVALLREHHDRVGEMIEFSAEHFTCDAQALRAHLEHDGPSAVSSGYL